MYLKQVARLSCANLSLFSFPKGDGAFDAFDFLPLVAIVIGTSLILAGLFPSGFTSLGIANGNVVIGRKDARDDDVKKSMLDEAIDQLETG